MLEILQFAFSDFAHFIGCLMFLLLVCVAVSNIKLVDVNIVYGDKKFVDKNEK